MPPCQSKLVAIYYYNYGSQKETVEVKIFARRHWDTNFSGCHEPKEGKPWYYDTEWAGPHLGNFNVLPDYSIIENLLVGELAL